MNYEELFRYYKAEREKLFAALSQMSEEDFRKNRELSFYSIKDVLVHTISVEDNWLHYRAAGLETESPVKPDELHTLSDVMKYAREVDAKTEKFLSGLTPSDLKKQVKRKYPDGRTNVYALEQVLYHVPIEILHHYGEIFAEFWKEGKDAPYYSYLAFSSKTS